MHVGDLLQTEGLNLSHLWGGENLLGRAISGVTATDLEDPARFVQPGEVVLSGLVWWNEADGRARTERFVSALARAGATALLMRRGDPRQRPRRHRRLVSSTRHRAPGRVGAHHLPGHHRSRVPAPVGRPQPPPRRPLRPARVRTQRPRPPRRAGHRRRRTPGPCARSVRCAALLRTHQHRAHDRPHRFSSSTVGGAGGGEPARPHRGDAARPGGDHPVRRLVPPYAPGGRSASPSPARDSRGDRPVPPPSPPHVRGPATDRARADCPRRPGRRGPRSAGECSRVLRAARRGTLAGRGHDHRRTARGQWRQGSAQGGAWAPPRHGLRGRHDDGRRSRRCRTRERRGRPPARRALVPTQRLPTGDSAVRRLSAAPPGSPPDSTPPSPRPATHSRLRATAPRRPARWP